jgi:hypothetical protein
MFRADVEKEMAVITGTWNKSLVMGKGDIFWEPPLIGTEARKYFKPSALLVRECGMITVACRVQHFTCRFLG